MRCHQTFIFFSCIIAACALAQDIGQQGTDPFTGRPANPTAQVTTPQSNSHASPSANGGHRLVFRSRTVLVEVPAVVTDRSGKHIHNLTKKDFKVLEDGKQQQIAVFEEVSVGNARLAPHTTATGTFSNIVFDTKRPASTTIIVLDTINTPFLDQAYGRKQLIKYLADTLDFSHVFGLVAIGRKGITVLGDDLNSDPAALIAGLKKASGELSPMEAFSTEGKVMAASESNPSELGGIAPGADPAAVMRNFILNADALEGNYQQNRAIEDTMRAFLELAWSLSGIPGRKSLIWATGSFPFPLDSPSALPGGNLSLLYERTIQALNDAQIAVYPVDLRGLIGTSPTGDATYSGGLSGPEFTNAAGGRSSLLNSSLRSLENFAAMTGGRAYSNNNDLVKGFKRAADDSSSYYLLGYYLDTHNTKPGWRKLQVQVARNDFEVHARSGILFTNTAVDPQMTRAADIGFALNSPFDSTGIPVTMQWGEAASDRDKRKIGFVLHVPESSVIDEADQNRFDVDFIAQATMNGKPAGEAGQSIKGTVPTAALTKVRAEGVLYRNALELPPGEYQVRFVVRDNLRGTIGTVSAPLSVN
jgi:VWFA-related protein